MQGSFLQNLRRYLPVWIAALLLLLPIIAPPEGETYASAKTLTAVLIALGLGVFLLSGISWSLSGARRFLTTGPNLAMLLLLGWAAASLLIHAPTGAARSLALMELLRLGSGALILFAVAYRCSSRDRLNQLVTLALLGGIFAALAGLIYRPDTAAEAGISGGYGNAQLFAAFLVLLMPLALVYASRGEMGARRLMALAATVLILGALLLTKNRSSWIGGSAGILAVALLALRGRSWRELMARKHEIVVPLLGLLVAGILFVVMSGTGGILSARAGAITTVGGDASFQWRLEMWRATRKMIRDEPLIGFGAGSFPLEIGKYTALSPAPDYVAEHGSSLSSIAHNEYLQVWAELGAIGLALYLAVILAFLWSGIRAIPRVRSETRKSLLIAAIGAIVAASINALGNPAWRYPEVSAFYWMMMGIGLAATRSHRERSDG